MKPLTFTILVILLVAPFILSAQWLCPWENRQKITITEESGEALTDYQVRVIVPFQTGMSADYSDLRFTLGDGTTLMTYYLEAHTATSATVWLKVPALAANSKIEIYQYFCNPDAATASDPANTFIFYDDFQTFNGWNNWGTGVVFQDLTSEPGTSLLNKGTNCDPNGGQKAIGQTINSFRLISREYRPDSGTGCGRNRYGLEDGAGNGYSLNRNAEVNGTSDFGFERRVLGSGNQRQSTNLFQPDDIWYRTELTRCEDDGNGILTAQLYSDTKNFIGERSGINNSFNQFSHVAVRGGRPYYFDYMAVGKFTCDEPSVDYKGSVENDIPEIVCMDITISLDENGAYVLDPLELLASSEDCNELKFAVTPSSLDCTDLGNVNVTVSAKDAHGNETECTAKVTVEDNEIPEVTCPSDITVTANLASCQAKVTWLEPVATDNCGITDIGSNYSSGEIFDLGVTTVSYKFADESDNINSCSFTITVISNINDFSITAQENSGLTDNDNIVCSGDEFCLEAPAGFALYSWSNGSITNPNCTTTAGTYDVTVTNDIGCTLASNSLTVTALELPVAGTCNIMHDLCQDSNGSVEVQASNGLPPYQINWTPVIDGTNSGAINSAGGSYILNNIPGGTTIEFSIVDQNGCMTN